MNAINVHIDEVEFTSDPSEVIYGGDSYVILSQLDDELTLILQENWDTEIDQLAKQIDETDKEIKKLLKGIIKNDENKKHQKVKKKPTKEKIRMP